MNQKVCEGKERVNLKISCKMSGMSKENHGSLNQNSRYLEQDLNLELPKYEA
jgi:hypothetical protein